MTEFKEISKALFGSADRLDIWETILQLPQPFHAKQVADVMSIPKANVYKELVTLKKFRYIIPAELPEDYVAKEPGIKMLVVPDIDFWRNIVPIIREARQKFPEEEVQILE